MNRSSYSVDVLLATYNGAKYIDEQIASLFAQTCNDFRVIARDDGSSDETLEILKKYQSDYGSRFVVVDDAMPSGTAKANFSRLSELSTAPYVMYCDQDDYWHSRKVELTLAAMLKAEHENPGAPVLIHSDLRVVNSSRQVIAESFWRYQGLNPAVVTTRRLIVQNNVTGCCVMVNRNLLDKSLPMPDNILMHDWWLALVASVIGKIVAVNTPLIDYRQHASNDTGAKSYSSNYIVQRIFSQLFKERLSASRKMIEQTRQQAAILLAQFESYMPEKDRRALRFFSTLGSYGYLSRKVYLLRYGILKQGLFRNMAFIVSA